MQIPSGGSANYGQLGLQRSQDSLQQASTQVANASTALQSVSDAGNTINPQADLQGDLINANISELNAQANAKVIGAVDEMLGTLIDVKV